jgi:hypothetical protein
MVCLLKGIRPSEGDAVSAFMTQSRHDRLGVCLRSIQKADRFTFRDSNSLSFCMHWSQFGVPGLKP